MFSTCDAAAAASVLSGSGARDGNGAWRNARRIRTAGLMRTMLSALAIMALIASTTAADARGGRTTAADCEAGSDDPDCPDTPATGKAGQSAQDAKAPGGRSRN